MFDDDDDDDDVDHDDDDVDVDDDDDEDDDVFDVMYCAGECMFFGPGALNMWLLAFFMMIAVNVL